MIDERLPFPSGCIGTLKHERCEHRFSTCSASVALVVSDTILNDPILNDPARNDTILNDPLLNDTARNDTALLIGVSP